MLAVRAEQPVPFDHPVLAAMRDQGAAITSGALYARPDLMRAEVCVDRHGEAEGLFAYLAAMSDVSERRRTRETGPRSPRTGHVHLVRPLSDGTPPDTVQTG
jgi:hypothetical protein